MDTVYEDSEVCPSCGAKVIGSGTTSDAAYTATRKMIRSHILSHQELSPTPWSIQVIGPPYPGVIRDAQNHCIATIGGADTATRRFDMANMQLMAKAPEMRDHLVQAKALLERYLKGEEVDDAETTLSEVSALLTLLGIG